MKSTHSSQPQGKRSFFGRVVVLALKTLRFLVLALAGIWATLALYYSNIPWEWARLALAVTFAGFGIYTFCLNKTRKMRIAYAVVFLVVVAYFIWIPAKMDRDWRPEVAVLPRAYIDGDNVRITGVRSFTFRDRDDFDEHYKEIEVSLDDLTSVDLFISYWMPGPVAHTFVSFNFENSAPVCISIETRPEVGQGFDPLASMFKQFELIYVVGDERDLIHLRTNHRDEEVFLYKLKTPPAAARLLFLEYLRRINELAENPEWYHLLKQNCSLNIVRYKNVAGREGSFDIRHLLNGWIDRYFYDTEMIYTTLPFEEMREVSHINKVTKATSVFLGPEEYSRLIRTGLPGHDLEKFPEFRRVDSAVAAD